MTGISRIPAHRPRLRSAEFFRGNCRNLFENALPLDDGGRSLDRRGLRGFDAACCFGDYDGALRQLIHLFKYGKAQSQAGRRSILPADARLRDERFDGIAAPLHRRRRWRRGFHQAEVSRRRLSRRACAPVLRALRRARAAETQAGFSKSSRRRSVAPAFRARRGAPIEGKRILLVDDVMTNSPTGAACATTLKRAGAAKVAPLTVAQVDRRMDVWQARAAAAATGDV